MCGHISAVSQRERELSSDRGMAEVIPTSAAKPEGCKRMLQ